MRTAFISDCHLDAQAPEVLARVQAFLHACPSFCDQLYILGDFFEAWIGIDALADELQALREQCLRLSHTLPIYFQCGNRDFLFDELAAAQFGFRLLTDDEHCVSLGDTAVLLLHGDTLCTDDHAYQAFRHSTRSAEWQQAFLARHLEERRAIAAQLRSASREAMQSKSEQIMDVNAEAVDASFARHQTQHMIHGHTHRPACHSLSGQRQRHVLGDWQPEASRYLLHDADHGFQHLIW